ncbi:hypothetical protein DPMN_007367 [Dreissena polymorpha]|uniref:Uncharacterized protein n=1 Tax=Dreissena polymorpha TaxID=45954 RepID=A0A9D4RYN5_DREPO|nr:hypothetical protein DPMN_007367 [Dreissena polymorpha]
MDLTEVSLSYYSCCPSSNCAWTSPRSVYHTTPAVPAQTGHGPHQGQSITLLLLSQLKLCMDLTKVSLSYYTCCPSSNWAWTSPRPVYHTTPAVRAQTAWTSPRSVYHTTPAVPAHTVHGPHQGQSIILHLLSQLKLGMYLTKASLSYYTCCPSSNSAWTSPRSVYHTTPAVPTQTGHGPHQGQSIILHLLSQLKLGIDLTKASLSYYTCCPSSNCAWTSPRPVYHTTPAVPAQTGHGPHQGQSIILHLLSQLILGMDLTKVCLSYYTCCPNSNWAWTSPRSVYHTTPAVPTQTVHGPHQGQSIILHLLSQLKLSMDLTKVSLSSYTCCPSSN